jgi:putative phosphoribosyl transferase
MYHDRSDGALSVVEQLKGRLFCDPLVLAIPRGGVVTGAVIAEGLGAELDVVLSRKLRAPDQPELAMGAIAEGGEVYLNSYGRALSEQLGEYLENEKRHQLSEIKRRKALFRAVRPAASMTGRSIIVVDDGIATGSTMIAALQAAKLQSPHEMIVAVPVASPDRLEEIRRWCDEVVCPFVDITNVPVRSVGAKSFEHDARSTAGRCNLAQQRANDDHIDWRGREVAARPG